MKIVPVLDLRGGVVVHARGGDRARYAPLVSRLAPDADPLAVLAGLRCLFEFDCVYVADLDAIEDRADNAHALLRIGAQQPGLEIWLDAGLATERLCAQQRQLRPVIGTESCPDAPALRRRLEAAGASALLSLDYRGERLLGPVALMAAEWTAPQEVIVLDLARVGAASGPCLQRLRAWQARLPQCALYAAGGVRDDADLTALAQAGVAGVLLATALHEGRVTPATLDRLQRTCAAPATCAQRPRDFANSKKNAPG